MWRLGDSRAAAWVVRLRGLWLLHARGHHEASQEHPLYCYEIFRLPWTPSPTNKERCAKAGVRDARGADFRHGRRAARPAAAAQAAEISARKGPRLSLRCCALGRVRQTDRAQARGSWDEHTAGQAVG